MILFNVMSKQKVHVQFPLELKYTTDLGSLPDRADYHGL